ncbi:DUF2612 domain-containing protein [Pseudomonas citronellolis]|uniref:DUF2612 domain-containing protein n=1 Tax=Pseudomonas citronellolis TaxID=53408 RepID=UPI00389A1F0F
MADISDYLGLITSEHSDKPKFMATVQAVLQPLVDVINTAQGLPVDFDLDVAVGAQLDVVGLWVGISRNVNAPLSGVYFSFDVVGLGFDQGAWKGPFDPDTGIISLDDDTYRTLIRAKIGANRWDGTLGQSKEILDLIFSGETHVFIEDRQDMSIVLGVSGVIPSVLFLALLTGGYIPIKPEGVQMSVYVVTSVSGAPIFGFDMSNEYMAGFDVGAWGGSPDNVVYPQPLAFDFMTGVLDSLISFSRPGPAWRYNEFGIYEQVAANQPRFDYDPVTLALRGLLIEEQRTNLLTYSNDFTNAAWLKADTTPSTDGTLAPDGGPMQLLTQGSAMNGFVGRASSVSISPGTFTASRFFKRGNHDWVRLSIAADAGGNNAGHAWFNLATGTVGSTLATGSATSVTSRIRSCGGGIYRCEVSTTLATSTANSISSGVTGDTAFTRVSGGSRYEWLGQLEAGSFASSPIPTLGSQVTRAADVAFVPISAWFNNLEGTLQAKFQANSTAQTNRVASLFSGAGQMITIDSNGQCEVDGTFVSPSAAGGNAAVAFKAGDAAAAVAGAITSAGTPPALPDFPKALYLGSLDGQSQFLNGHLQLLTYQPKRLANSDLIALTT